MDSAERAQEPLAGDGWDCAAYGPEGREIGALCFMAGELHERRCGSLSACQQVMTAERQQVFAKIQEGAAAGDPDMTWLAGEFTHPDQLLGGQLEQAQRPEQPAHERQHGYDADSHIYGRPCTLCGEGPDEPRHQLEVDTEPASGRQEPVKLACFFCPGETYSPDGICGQCRCEGRSFPDDECDGADRPQDRE